MKNPKKHQIPTRKSHSKSFWAILLVVAILCIGSVSALDFTHTKSYDEDTRTVTIKSFPLIGRDITTIKLNTPLKYHVSTGYNKVAELEVNLFDDTYADAFNDMVFINKKTDKIIERQFDYKYLTIELADVNDYKKSCNTLGNGTKICSSELIGTHQEEREVWKDLDTSVLTKGKITIGIFTDVQVGDYVEWIPTLFGKEIDEWASFIDSISFDAASNGGGTATSITFAHTTSGSNRILFVGTGIESGSDLITNVTYAGVNMTPIAKDVNVPTNEWIYLFYLINPATGANNIVISASASVNIDGTGVSYTGANQATQPDNSTTNKGTQPLVTTLKTVDDNSWVISTTIRDAGDPVPGTGVTHRADNVNVYIGDSNGVQTPPGDYSMTWTGTSNLVTVQASFKPLEGFPPEVTLNTPINISNFTISSINFGGVASDASNLINVSLIVDDTYIQTNSSGINNSNYTFTSVLTDGSHTWTYEACNNQSFCTNGTARTLEIDTIFPAVIILAPPTVVDSHLLNTDLSFNWSANDTNIDTCIYTYEGINTTVTCSDNETGVNITNTVNRTIIFYVNDTFGHTTVNSTTWAYSFIETGSEFTVNVFETKNYSFALNVTSFQALVSFSAFLSHNGTTYSADSTCSSGDCEITAMIDIPLITKDSATENKTFFWRMSIFNGTTTLNINTSTQLQIVTAVNLDECNTAPRYVNVSSVNFTTHREVDRAALTANFNSFFQFYLGTGSVMKNSNATLTGASVYEFCIDQNETFTTNSNIDVSATSYEDRHYDLIRQIYTNTTTVQQLFLLNSTLSSNIIIEVRDEGLIPQSNIIVNISRFYPGVAKFFPVEIQVTDEFGQVLAKLIENDAKYRFTFYSLNGNLLKTSEDITIACRNVFCVVPFVLEDVTDEFARFDNLTTYSSTLSFDNTTNIFTFAWDDQRGESTITRLEVTRYQLNASTLVCNTSSTSTLSTLSCSVGSQRASYKAQAFRISDDDSRRIAVLNIKVGDISLTFGLEGLFWIFILLFTCIGIGAFNPTVGATLYGAGFIIMGFVGIISMPIPVFFANTLLVVLFVWGMNK